MTDKRRPTTGAVLPSRTALVGRVDELAFLKQQYDEVAAGAGGRLVFVSGEAGVGKTRLAREVGRSARRQGGALLEGSYFRDGTAPYGAWIDALRASLATLPPERLETPGVSGAVVAQLWPELSDRAGSRAETPVSAEAQRRRLFDGVVALLREIARTGPLVLIINDLQWAPELALLTHLARHVNEISALVIATYRDDELREQPNLVREWNELNRARLASDLKLHPLSETDVRALTAQYVGAAPAAQLCGVLHRRTRGNPFFLEEVLRSLAESGALSGGQVGVSALDPSAIPIPESMSAVILERVARLGDDARTLLTQAAVLGQQFGFRTLCGVLERPEEEVLPTVERAIAARLLEDRSVIGEERLGFVDDQVQETLYCGLTAPRRRRIHLRIAQALERENERRQDSQVEELAYHFLQANEAASALEYTLGAGNRAYRLAAWERAAQHFATALRLLEALGDDSPRRIQVLDRLVYLDYLLGRPGLPTIEAALASYLSAGNKPKAARMHRLLGMAWGSGLAGAVSWKRAIDHLRAAVALLEDELDSAEKALCLSGLGCLSYIGALDFETAGALLDQALALAERLGDADQIAHACSHRAGVLAHQGKLDEAEAYAERSWKAALEGQSPYLLLFIPSYVLVSWPWLNDREWVSRWQKRYATSLRRFQLERFESTMAGFTSLVGVLSGEPEPPARSGPRPDVSAGEPGEAYPFWLYFAGAAAAIRGDEDQAQAYFSRAFAADGGAWCLALVAAAGYYGRFLLDSGDTMRAEPLLSQVVTLARQRGLVTQELSLLPLLVELHVRAARLDQAEPELARAQDLLRGSHSWRGLAAGVHRASGLLATARADWTGAEAACTAALEVERSVGFPYFEARTLAAWADMYLARRGPGDRERA
ncbi:MAG: AAA family ATPase, partial [Chloroflexi bacterium]|nr:AAA family ATPase [Chloroflexota bacterium]